MILVVKILCDLLKEEQNWSLVYLRLFLEDSLSGREWVDLNDALFIRINILHWVKCIHSDNFNLEDLNRMQRSRSNSITGLILFIIRYYSNV